MKKTPIKKTTDKKRKSRESISPSFAGPTDNSLNTSILSGKRTNLQSVMVPDAASARRINVTRKAPLDTRS